MTNQRLRSPREEQARREIGVTEISPRLASVLVTAFLVTLLAVPLLQWGSDIAAERTAFWPVAAEIVTAGGIAASTFADTDGGIDHRVRNANRALLTEINRYENALADESVVDRRAVGPTRRLLASWCRWGTEEAWIGRDGWLFYQPDIAYVTGPPFMDPDVQVRRTRAGSEIDQPRQPDPLGSILHFHVQLKKVFDIQLVLVPTPSKPMIHPDRLSRRAAGASRPLHNRSYRELVEPLEADGVIVFDPSQALIEYTRRTGRPAFLKTDTHWTAEAMQEVARALAARLKLEQLIPTTASPSRWQTNSTRVTGTGDISAMLRLARAESVFPRESVAIRQVLDRDGQPWQPDPTAEILLLGDSFTNVYSLKPMTWGQSAGFAEQLSYELARPIARIARNADGAHATRAQLARDMLNGRHRLTGKTVVIWQFAVRELTHGDWRRITLPDESPPGPRSPGSRLVVRATVQANSRVPAPNTVPYADAVASLHLVDVEPVTGNEPARVIVVYAMGMKARKHTRIARLKPGDRVTLKLTPWSEVESTYRRLNRIDLDDPDFKLIDLPTYWGELQ